MKAGKLVISKWRILLGTFLLVSVILIAMSMMLLYRLSLLPLAVSSYCGQVSVSDYCIATVSEHLLYDHQWLSLQFTVYLLLSFVLFPIFKNSLGSPIINLLIVGLLSTGLIALLTENSGVEIYSSIFNPVFIGLILHSMRKRRIVFNKV